MDDIIDSLGEWNRTQSQQNIKSSMMPSISLKNPDVEEDNIQDPMSFGTSAEQFNKKCKTPFIKIKPKLNKTALGRKEKWK